MKAQRKKKIKSDSPTARVKELRLNDLLNPDSCRIEQELSGDALKRFESIPLLSRLEPSVEVRSGRVAYDTWDGAGATSLRDAAPGYIRRVTLKAGKLVLELVAERRKTDWEFVGRVYDGTGVRHDFVLRAGKNRVLPRSGGFYRWSSVAVPRLVRLNSYQHDVAFEELAW